jgi:hypothetical protein
MEINRFDNALGAVALADVKEGLMVVRVDDGAGNPAARVPATQAEAIQARWVAVWPQNYMPMPGPLAWPATAGGFSLREGAFDVAQNNQPMVTNIWLTYPGMQEGTTIPSGYDLVTHGGGEGTYTVESGMFVVSSNLTVGAKLEALNTADDTTNAGKLSYTTVDADAVAYVVKYDATNFRLTFRTREL